MSQTVSQDFRSPHPLAGLESWPPTGPVYGLVEDEGALRPSTLWVRLAERFRKSPQGESVNPGQARIWY